MVIELDLLRGVAFGRIVYFDAIASVPVRGRPGRRMTELHAGQSLSRMSWVAKLIHVCMKGSMLAEIEGRLFKVSFS